MTLIVKNRTLCMAGKLVEMSAPVQHLAGGLPDRCTVWVMTCNGTVGLIVFGGTQRLGASQDWRDYLCK
jgi:hypothetical protein